MKSGFMVLAIAGVLISSDGDKPERSQAAPTERLGWLLPGYQFEKANGVGFDTAGGRIWKENGPDVSYLLTATARERARIYAEENPKASLYVVTSPTTGEIVVALDEDQAAMLVSVDRRAHFEARNIRSRKDAVEVIMIATAAAGHTK